MVDALTELHKAAHLEARWQFSLERRCARPKDELMARCYLAYQYAMELATEAKLNTRASLMH